MTDEDAGGGWLSDVGHGILDVAGLIPVVGEVADGVNALWYAAEGDYAMAGLSAAAMVPFLGWGATGLKGLRYVDEATDALSLAGRPLELPPGRPAPLQIEPPVRRGPDFVANADGVVIPTNRVRME